jgi:hypothetical protein
VLTLLQASLSLDSLSDKVSAFFGAWSHDGSCDDLDPVWSHDLPMVTCPGTSRVTTSVHDTRADGVGDHTDIAIGKHKGVEGQHKGQCVMGKRDSNSIKCQHVGHVGIMHAWVWAWEMARPAHVTANPGIRSRRGCA